MGDGETIHIKYKNFWKKNIDYIGQHSGWETHCDEIGYCDYSDVTMCKLRPAYLKNYIFELYSKYGCGIPERQIMEP
jgi:hypothetical protein